MRARSAKSPRSAKPTTRGARGRAASFGQGTPARPTRKRTAGQPPATKANANRVTARVTTAAGSAKRPAARTRESDAARRARALRVLDTLREHYPEADCALRHGSALELLVATILSAQCTDERVNMVTPRLFARFPTVDALAAAEQAALEDVIRSTGFFRNKARNLRGMAQMIRDAFGGEVPRTMEELLRLPGVARKTANCVLGTWFGANAGVVVDTHVGRLAQRLGFLKSGRNSKDAQRIEQDLMELFPREAWTYLAHALIWHGRRICTARGPKCELCPLAPDCPSAGKVRT